MSEENKMPVQKYVRGFEDQFVYVLDEHPPKDDVYVCLMFAKQGYEYWGNAEFKAGKWSKVILNEIEYCVCFWRKET